MPTYAYACKNCGHRFDAVQAFSEAALTVCPECGGELRKEYGSIGVTFNGPGFYRTDSRGGSSGGEKPVGGKPGESSGESRSDHGAASPGPSSTPTSSKSETKSPAAPAAS